jgi:hypothetical protein
VKKVVWISAGASGAAQAMPTPAKRAHAAPAKRRRIGFLRRFVVV